jgi:hypothetical protein
MTNAELLPPVTQFIGKALQENVDEIHTTVA